MPRRWIQSCPALDTRWLPSLLDGTYLSWLSHPANDNGASAEFSNLPSQRGSFSLGPAQSSFMWGLQVCDSISLHFFSFHSLTDHYPPTLPMLQTGRPFNFVKLNSTLGFFRMHSERDMFCGMFFRAVKNLISSPSIKMCQT